METKTVVLKIPKDLYDRIYKYGYSDSDVKYLMLTGIQDYVAKREARTRRAERQREGK
jgi:hypothetical protein